MAEADVRLLIGDPDPPADYHTSAAILAALARNLDNDYKAAAELLRTEAAIAARKAVSYKTTDMKAMDRTRLPAALLASAKTFDELAAQGATYAVVDGRYEVDETGDDLTEYDEN